jgi:mannose-1-phosphate guanylyltransferase
MTTHLYTIVLAAGEGTRVRSLTRNAEGVSVPKQFSVVDGHRTMLDWALSRATRLVPKERVVVVVAKEHERWWRRDLAGLPPENIVIQPCNRGTAVGLLLPFLKVLQRDPQAQVLVLPSDHQVENEKTLHEAIVEALRAVSLDSRRVVLLGAFPLEPDTEYGWIVPHGALDGIRGVAMFKEKPDKRTARALMDRGAVLNTLILVAAGRSLLHLYTRHLPGLLGELVSWRDNARVPERELEQLYQSLPTRDLSRDVLSLSCENLAVLPVVNCGWSDLGTPARLGLFQRQQSSASSATLDDRPSFFFG